MKTPADIGTPTQELLDGSEYNPLFKNGWGTFNGDNPSEIYVNGDASLFTGPSWIGYDLEVSYYLNPTINDRNVEFDPKQNLIKNLKPLEQVKEP